MRLQFLPYNLIFKRPAGTSRGVLTDKITCLIRIFDEKNPEIFGIGEAGIFPGLSPEADDRFFYKLMELQANFRIGKATDLSHFPSLQSGLEQAIRDYACGCNQIYFPSNFTEGKSMIPTNGLIWMGDYQYMEEQIQNKIDQNFKCIKLKIGAIDWDTELALIKDLRYKFNENDLEIRVDANGAFSCDNVNLVLNQLADLAVHSIEQPIKAGNLEAMATLCKTTPLPIALDEELIGKYDFKAKHATIRKIKPQYIVLKPSLIGGYTGSEEWIQLANDHNIGWWITSALESNIGLNAIAQWVATLGTNMHQGLGTGKLYTNNFEVPLYMEGENLGYNPLLNIDKNYINALDWRE